MNISIDGVPYVPQAEVERLQGLVEQRCVAHAAYAVKHGDCPICDLEQAEAEVERLRSENATLRDCLAVAAPAKGGAVVAVPVRELNALRVAAEQNATLREALGEAVRELTRAVDFMADQGERLDRGGLNGSPLTTKAAELRTNVCESPQRPRGVVMPVSKRTSVGREPAREYAATKAGLAAMRRHERLVEAAHEAIYSLRSPFGENDEIPGAIQDALDVLEAALNAR